MDSDHKQAQISCPECGAAHVMGVSCRAQFETVLAWEWRDPQLQAVHFLTVASYNLQHPAQFTAEALAGLRFIFIDHIDHKTPVSHLRRQVAHLLGGSQKVLVEDTQRRQVLYRWPMTITDVYNFGHAPGASERVRLWAHAIRDQMDSS